MLCDAASRIATLTGAELAEALPGPPLSVPVTLVAGRGGPLIGRMRSLILAGQDAELT
jgi:hypothetical protein